ncbi:MAG: hypothetical protein HZB79_08810 [Deltaproteobacteria bacterium]|nr:hypothetical protein [Deltaproteobacteria bacterium]
MPVFVNAADKPVEQKGSIELKKETAPFVSEVERKEYPNPHWKEGLCNECHEGIPEKGRKQAFKYGGDIIKMCNSCHDVVSAHKYIHATGMVPSEEKLNKMPDDFKKALNRGDKEGKMTCLVCHEMLYQCLKENYNRKAIDSRFFRGGPYNSRTEICYNCHDASQYARLDPHEQITDEGEILIDKCIICHKITPDVKRVKGIEDVRFQVDEDFAQPLKPGEKPGEEKVISHIRLPYEKVLKRYKFTEAEREYVLPLEPGTGKITCATCHNPHERGIQKFTKADRGADNRQRLRAGGGGALCMNCHDK